MGRPTVADVLSTVASGDLPAAVDLAAEAAEGRPRDELASRLAAYLRSRREHDVYGSADGFREFVDNASNPALYDSAISALGSLHRELRPRSVVDIGAGDGRVTSAVVGEGTEQLVLVEPSSDLLEAAMGRTDWSIEPAGTPTGLAGFVEGLEPDSWFDLAQSTFALHTIEPRERVPLLARLRDHVGVFVTIDFDVEAFADRSHEHARYAEARYRVAIDEYRAHPQAVEEFLLPVLVAQFDPHAERLTFEQPARRWEEEFRAAGFTTTTTRLHDHWWAPAFLLRADASLRR